MARLLSHGDLLFVDIVSVLHLLALISRCLQLRMPELFVVGTLL